MVNGVSRDNSSYKSDLFTKLKATLELDNKSRSTSIADYNFVTGAKIAGFPPKRSDNCTTGIFTGQRFCERNSKNGGDPKLKMYSQTASDPILGPDGVPFSKDDGLKPLPGSPLCGNGANGSDIGAYNCDPEIVFSTGDTGNLTADPNNFPGSARPASPANFRIF